MQELDMLKDEVSFWKTLSDDIADTVEIAEASKDDSKLDAEISSKVSELEESLRENEFKVFLKGKYDQGNAVVSIHAGAGGVDAQDWAEMLMKMVLRFSEDKKFKVETLSLHKGEEAGIKSATFNISGLYAYGLLKSESGVHRLVRLSPFDGDSQRHTSFALVEVIPFLDDPQVEINPEDLKIDTYRASSAGGQHVNKTNSAVRITHLPSKAVVTCQTERSQSQNKETALHILKSKIAKIEEDKREEERLKARGEFKSPEWGSQIRSYVIHPYKLVKDHRTKHEEKNVDAVLNGKIQKFIEAYLEWANVKK